MKRLIIRLSSLGDLILSQAVLEIPYSGDTHWLVAKEFESIVHGNPKIVRVWGYDRRARGGLIEWIAFLSKLRAEEFDEVLDLHSTLRTTIARLYFLLQSRRTRWKKISKERVRRVGYEIFKQAWPAEWRPTHLAGRCARLAGGSGFEAPNLRWLVPSEHTEKPIVGSTSLQKSSVRIGIGVVPSSAWPGKEWPAGLYVEWLEKYRVSRPECRPILLGTEKDSSATLIRDLLRGKGIPFEDGVGKYRLVEVAAVLAKCAVVVGADTGLLHLAEALGIPVVTLFGPTRNDFGFGALHPRSHPVESTLWCSPCSKDGTLCFRLSGRFACLRGISPSSVEAAADKILEGTRS